MGGRRRAREHAVQMLYQADLGSMGCAETCRVHWERETDVPAETRRFADRLVRAVLTNLETIDALISELSQNWRLDRIGAVDRAILRLAIAELRTESDTPPAVVIDEAVEIAKVFGEPQTRSFVHGIVEAARRRIAPSPTGGGPGGA